MTEVTDFKQALEEKLNTITEGHAPQSLYEPIAYMLNIGGKRVRPQLVTLSADCFGSAPENALPLSMAVEVFHNFTLMHDDIMDNAPIRRGKTTVHEKWDLNTAILSGDAMLIKAYTFLEKLPAQWLLPTFKLFNKTALEVCEGQQFDMDFETRDDVTIDEYIEMIRLKTAVLVGAALQLGAITAEASVEQQKAIYDFGQFTGIAFQLIDDLLDAFGGEKVGKQQGGDIISNKKTFLLLKTQEKASSEDQKEIEAWLSKTEFDNQEKVDFFLAMFDKYGIREECETLIEEYHQKALNSLNKTELSSDKKAPLILFADRLKQRKH